MGTLKDRHGMDLTEAEDIQNIQKIYSSKNTQKNCTKKDLHEPDNHDGVIINQPRARHPGMRSKVGVRKHHYEQSKWSDGILIELFQILKDNAVKVLHSICQQTWKTQQWPQDWKRSVFTPIPKKSNAK